MMALLAGCAVVAPSLPGLAPGFIRKDGLVAQSLPVLGWLRDQAPPIPTREAVLAVSGGGGVALDLASAPSRPVQPR